MRFGIKRTTAIDTRPVTADAGSIVRDGAEESVGRAPPWIWFSPWVVLDFFMSRGPVRVPAQRRGADATARAALRRHGLPHEGTCSPPSEPLGRRTRQ